MKFAVMALIMCVAGYLAWRQLKPVPPAAEVPPPPPAILLEPAPVINEEEQQKIVKSANDQDPAVRWEAILFLDKLKAPIAYDVMFDKLQRDQDPQLRIKIIELLGKRGALKTAVLQPADRFDPKYTPQVSAVMAAQEKRARDIAQNLVWSTKDLQPEVRIAALKALDELGDYSVASSIMDSLKDMDEQVRLQALKTLNSLQDKKAASIEAERKRQEELRRKAESGQRK